ncbi:alpha/beta hydrolase family protein [Actinoplanes sp. NPDC049265]|uniref:alpha/beta hydrolase family protein n=1 Tax=Actinoplanes sp. NPDC049265 TaxID=3363902 RepID=UPI00371DB8C9
MTRRIFSLCMIGTLVVLAAVAPAAAAQPATAGGRGEVVAVNALRSLERVADVRAELAGAGFGTDSVRFGVDTFQVVYRTVDPAGRPTVASGLLSLPRGGGKALRAVVYTHGTEINRLDAPSMWRDGWGAGPNLTYASAGFAAIAPDYLGLGLGPGTHPFLDLPSETSASLDMLRAARRLVADGGRTLDRGVLLTGFSQGASAATALGRHLLAGGDPWFRLRALAPISGAYDFRRVELPALLGGTVPRPYNVGYLSYLVVAWNRLHGLYATPGEIFAAPYAATVEKLFDGLHAGPDLASGLPATPPELFTPRGLALLRHPTGPFAAALAVHDASCGGFAGRVPVRLFVSRADEQVPAASSDHCRRELAGAGIDAPIVDVPVPPDAETAHLTSNITGTAQAVAWFTGLA